MSIGLAIRAVFLMAFSCMFAMEAAAQAPAARTEVRYGYCFPSGANLVYAKAPAKSVSECSERCAGDPRCAAFEIWDHTYICKLFSDIPRDTPRPQTVFPQNRKQNGVQAQAALGIKVTEGF